MHIQPIEPAKIPVSNEETPSDPSGEEAKEPIMTPTLNITASGVESQREAPEDPAGQETLVPAAIPALCKPIRLLLQYH